MTFFKFARQGRGNENVLERVERAVQLMYGCVGLARAQLSVVDTSCEDYIYLQVEEDSGEFVKRALCMENVEFIASSPVLAYLAF